MGCSASGGTGLYSFGVDTIQNAMFPAKVVASDFGCGDIDLNVYKTIKRRTLSLGSFS
jgi:hypothetical protein